MKKTFAPWGILFLVLCANESRAQKSRPITKLPTKTLAESQGVTNVMEPVKKPEPSTPAAKIPATLAPREEAEKAPIVRVEEEVEVERAMGRPHLNVDFGYVHSRWSEISPRLKNGSSLFAIGFSREFVESVEGGLGLSFLSPASSADSDMVYAMQINFDLRYLPFEGSVRPYAGLGLAFGYYRSWTLLNETPSSATFAKDGSGVLVGLIPALGVECALTPHFAVDLAARYFAYFDQPASRLGNWALTLGLSFSR